MAEAGGAQDDFTRLRAAFGTTDLVHSLFDRFPCALRFELGGDVWPISDPLRALRAIDRARAIVATLWPDLTRVALVFVALDAIDATALSDAAEAALRDCGLDPRALTYLGGAPLAARQDLPPPAPGLCAHNHLYRADGAASAQRALWGAICAETPMRPRLVGLHPVLVDLDRRIAAHAYDDRWMDVVAMNPGALDSLAKNRASWLCDGYIKRGGV